MRPLTLIRPVVRLTCLAGVLAACAPSGALALEVQPTGATITVANSNHGDTLWPGDSFNVSTGVQNGAYFITSRPTRGQYTAQAAQQLTHVQGTLSGDPTALTFSSAFSAFPDIAVGGRASNTTPFSATLSAGYECGAPVPASLALHADQGDATLPYTLPTGTAGPPQSYDSSGPARQIPDPGSTLSTIHVGDAGRVKHLTLRIGQIAHSRDSDLKIQVIAPDGTTATLVDGQGGGGHDYVNTVFDDSAAQGIDGAGAPFTGTYRPEQPLSVFDGKPMAGDWTLKVVDQVAGNFGVLVSWGADLSPATCSPLPVASFTATPNPALAGASVTLDARSSVDPTGNIVDYAWDLDGNGTYETDQQGRYGANGAGRLTHTFPRGAHVVGLKITDDQGRTATKSLTVNVTDSPPPGSGGTTGGGTTGGGTTGGTSGGTTGGGHVSGATFVGVLGGSPIQRARGVASRGLLLTCRANRTARCSMTLQLTAAQARRMHLRARRGSRMVRVGSASVSLRANRTEVVRLRLSRSAQRALRRSRMRSLALLVVGTIRDAAGHTVRVNRVVLVRL